MKSQAYRKLYVKFMKLLFNLRKVEKEMATVYATLIIKGKRDYKSVPKNLKLQVREILISLDCEDLIVEE